MLISSKLYWIKIWDFILRILQLTFILLIIDGSRIIR